MHKLVTVCGPLQTVEVFEFSSTDAIYSRRRFERIDLSRMELDDITFRECSLYAINLHNSTLKNCTFENCFAVNWHMQGSTIDDSRFSDCYPINGVDQSDWVGGRPSSSHFDTVVTQLLPEFVDKVVHLGYYSNLKFVNIDLSMMKFVACEFVNCEFNRVNFEYTTFDRSLLKGNTFIDCDLSKVALLGDTILQP